MRGRVVVLACVVALVAVGCDLVVTPHAQLSGGQIVSVSDSGFVPGHTAGYCEGVVVQHPKRVFCGTATDFAQAFEVAPVNVDGTFNATLRVERYIFVYGLNRIVDCTRVPQTCAVIAFDATDVSPTHPVDVQIPPGADIRRIQFAKPPPPPALRGAIQISPNTVLSGEFPGGPTPVNVTGSGFRPGAVVDLYLCSPNPTERADCERLPFATGGSATATADAQGVVRFDGQLAFPQSLFFEFNVGGGKVVDCNTGLGGCVVAAAEAVDFSGTVTTTPITFLHPSPAVVVFPQVELDRFPGQPIYIDALSWAANAPTIVGECSAVLPANEPPVASFCDNLQQLTTDANGNARTTMFPKSSLATSLGSVDCSSAFACEIRVAQQPAPGTWTVRRVPISFPG